MKKLLSVAIAIVMILAIAGTVNAASLTVSSTEVKAGDEVKVTVKLEAKTGALELELNYNPEVFEYVGAASDFTSSSSMVMVNSTKYTDKIIVTAAGTEDASDYMTFTFKAKADGAAAFKLGDKLVTETDEAIEAGKNEVTVDVQKAEEKPSEDPETPSETPEEPTNDEPQATAVPTKKPATLPQTGTPTVMYATVAILAVVAVAVVAKKLTK